MQPQEVPSVFGAEVGVRNSSTEVIALTFK